MKSNQPRRKILTPCVQKNTYKQKKEENENIGCLASFLKVNNKNIFTKSKQNEKNNIL